jgi:uncharacterized damage-inducible protein DinB
LEHERGMNFDLARSLEILERTPVVLAGLLAGLGEEWTGSNEGPETWSPFDVVGHLIDAEETDWMERTRIIVSDAPERRFKPFDRFRHLGANEERRLPELLERFAALRRRNLADLNALDLKPSDLARTGEHPEFGTVTLAQLLATWVVHDLNHIGQIARVMSKQFKVAVGPWVAYLPILTR